MTFLTRWKNSNIDILLVYKIIIIDINKILIHKSVTLFHFILKLGLIKIMSVLMEIPILKKIQHKHKTTFNSFVTTLYLS